MDDWKNYLDNYTAQIKKSLGEELDQYKNNLTTELNAFLLKEISNAEEMIKIDQEKYIADFTREMEKIEEDKKKDSEFAFLYDMEMEFVKNSFERQMRITERLWKSHIEKCKSEMK